MNNVLIVGAGNMGEAMLKGWLKANNMLKQVYVREPDPSNWLKKARRLQQGNSATNQLDKLINGLDLGSSDPNHIYKPDPDELGGWFSGAPSWVARS